jgi:hypothetical protein
VWGCFIGFVSLTSFQRNRISAEEGRKRKDTLVWTLFGFCLGWGILQTPQGALEFCTSLLFFLENNKLGEMTFDIG